MTAQPAKPKQPAGKMSSSSVDLVMARAAARLAEKYQDGDLKAGAERMRQRAETDLLTGYAPTQPADDTPTI